MKQAMYHYLMILCILTGQTLKKKEIYLLKILNSKKDTYFNSSHYINNLVPLAATVSLESISSAR